MHQVITRFGVYDRPKFLRLKKRYAQALEAKEKTFMFDDGELLVDLVKYLIEFLEPKFTK